MAGTPRIILINTIIIYLITILLAACVDVAFSNQEDDSETVGPYYVHIAPNGIIMPIGRVLLVRRNSAYCAVKFTKFWVGKTDGDHYARYESYYQDDGTGNLSNKNIISKKAELYSPNARWSLFGHPVTFGAKKEIECGPIKLWWTGKGSVYFYKRYQTEGDYGIELAPTLWTDISEVNVFDKQIKWYRYDDSRSRVDIPIEQLWKNKLE